MKRVSFAGSECPIARAADAVGDVWSLLILRDVFDGSTRFDQLQRGLGIAPNMLTRRLGELIDAGLLERRRYSERPPRDEYVPTARGGEFRQVVLALYAAGGMHDDPATLVLVDRATGEEVEPVLVDRRTGRPIEELDVTFTVGPGAGPRLREKLGR